VGSCEPAHQLSVGLWFRSQRGEERALYQWGGESTTTPVIPNVFRLRGNPPQRSFRDLKLPATTEFVAFLDGDDVLLPTKTERQVAFLKSGHRDFVAVDHMLMTEEGQVFAYALARHLPMPSTWMVRRDTMICHPFDPNVGKGRMAPGG
jgi:hypothetical protein